jgi:hypothetical protein
LTIIFVALRNDLHVDAIIDKATELDHCIRMDPGEIVEIGFDSGSDGFRLDDVQLSRNNVSGVCCRYPLELQPLDSSVDPVTYYRHAECIGAIRGMLLAISPSRWINFPWHENAADGKVRPLQVAQQVGLSVPPFIVTNNLTQLDSWIERNGTDLIIKSITDTAIARQNGSFVKVPDFSSFTAPYTSRFDRRLLNPENTDSTPFLIQKRIEKVLERRVGVIDDTIYVTQAECSPADPLDIRLKSGRSEVLGTLSAEDQRGVLELRSQLNLRFMTLDFAVDAEDTSWLLDVNPSGNWLWQEQQLSLGIPARIAAALVGAISA